MYVRACLSVCVCARVSECVCVCARVSECVCVCVLLISLYLVIIIPLLLEQTFRSHIRIQWDYVCIPTALILHLARYRFSGIMKKKKKKKLHTC